MDENEAEIAAAWSDLDVGHDWEAVRAALEALCAYLVKYEPDAKNTIEEIEDIIGALPGEG